MEDGELTERTQRNLSLGPCNVSVAWPVFPWLRFVYAEGDPSRVRIEFASYRFAVSGHRLAAMLAMLSDQRMVRLLHSTGKEGKFDICGASQPKHADPSVNVEPLS